MVEGPYVLASEHERTLAAERRRCWIEGAAFVDAI
jgi:hypothetical protein